MADESCFQFENRLVVADESCLGFENRVVGADVPSFQFENRVVGADVSGFCAVVYLHRRPPRADWCWQAPAKATIIGLSPIEQVHFVITPVPTISKTFEREGLVFPIDVLQPQEVAAARAGLAELTAMAGPILSIGWSHLFFDWAYQLVSHWRVLDAVHSVLGPDLLVQGSLVLTKSARHPGRFCWHQDGLHTNYNPRRAVTAWIALTPSNSDNGGMCVLPASHSRRLAHHAIDDPLDLARNAVQVQLDINPKQVVSVNLKPGQMSLHHPFLVHASPANLSDTPRVGFIVRYGTPETRVSDPVLSVAGAGDYGHLVRAHKPPAGSPAERVQAWRTFEHDRVWPVVPS